MQLSMYKSLLNELKAKGKLSKKEELKILRQKIKALRDKGFKNKEISIDLNIPIKTLERHITYMRKNRLFTSTRFFYLLIGLYFKI